MPPPRSPTPDRQRRSDSGRSAGWSANTLPLVDRSHGEALPPCTGREAKLRPAGGNWRQIPSCPFPVRALPVLGPPEQRRALRGSPGAHLARGNDLESNVLGRGRARKGHVPLAAPTNRTSTRPTPQPAVNPGAYARGQECTGHINTPFVPPFWIRRMEELAGAHVSGCQPGRENGSVRAPCPWGERES